jgi:hypothetical protein
VTLMGVGWLLDAVLLYFVWRGSTAAACVLFVVHKLTMQGIVLIGNQDRAFVQALIKRLATGEAPAHEPTRGDEGHDLF